MRRKAPALRTRPGAVTTIAGHKKAPRGTSRRGSVKPAFSVMGLLMRGEDGADVLVELSRFVLGPRSMVRAFLQSQVSREPVTLSRDEHMRIGELVTKSLLRLRQHCIGMRGPLS